VLEPLGAKGWAIVFATTRVMQMPALDYLAGTDVVSSDPRFPVTPEHVGRLASYMQQIRLAGPEGLNRKQFKRFSFGDAGMGEFRVVAHRGHRFVSILNRRQIVVCTGFRKPEQEETPEEEKRRAREVFGEHIARLAAPPQRKSAHH
jgi:hypothetical protein